MKWNITSKHKTKTAIKMKILLLLRTIRCLHAWHNFPLANHHGRKANQGPGGNATSANWHVHEGCQKHFHHCISTLLYCIIQCRALPSRSSYSFASPSLPNPPSRMLQPALIAPPTLWPLHRPHERPIRCSVANLRKRKENPPESVDSARIVA